MPGPFALAVLITLVVGGAALVFFVPAGQGVGTHTLLVSKAWYRGMWEGPMLVFAFQMMLILVLGHALALSAPIDALLAKATGIATNTARAGAIVALVSVVAGFLNWGLALIAGAVLARKVGEQAIRKGYRIHYPLIGAAGYTGMMVWHGGLSGSSLIKAAEPGHLAALMEGTPVLGSIPDAVGFGETLFSPMNLSLAVALLFIIPFSAWALGRNAPATHHPLKHYHSDLGVLETEEGPAAKLNRGPVLPVLLAVAILLSLAAHATLEWRQGNAHFVDPNFINFALFALALLAHGSLDRLGQALEKAASGAAAIMVQFPLYFGIMGIMKYTGMVQYMADFFVAISTPTTYPLFTFAGAAVINFFVPSGGGQWMIQGPIIVASAMELGVPVGKSILAMAYGDQITNMLQPFWALPLLAITGLKARDILPYTVYFMAIGTALYAIALVIFTG